MPAAACLCCKENWAHNSRRRTTSTTWFTITSSRWGKHVIEDEPILLLCYLKWSCVLCNMLNNIWVKWKSGWSGFWWVGSGVLRWGRADPKLFVHRLMVDCYTDLMLSCKSDAVQKSLWLGRFKWPLDMYIVGMRVKPCLWDRVSCCGADML